MSFDKIFGNNAIKQLLHTTVATNNVLHSYLFIGPDGIGKSLFAMDFANMILCLSPDLDTVPCGHCKSCLEFKNSNHPDFFLVKPEDGKSIKIEQIRFLQEKIAEKPIISSRKVYIIDNADCMTKEAQNCLLKTLEEPPEYATIILISSNENKLLHTIRSRTTKIVFQHLSNVELRDCLVSQGLDVPNNENVFNLCGGSVGKAIKLQENFVSYKELDKLISMLTEKDVVELWKNSDILYKSKDSIQELLEYMNIVFMDRLLQTQDPVYIHVIEIIEQTKKRLESNANFDMSIDYLLLQIWEEFHEKCSRG